MPYQQLSAKGHVANILLFDEKTAFLPLNEVEVTRLLSALDNTIRVLTKSGDFPEKNEYISLRENLQSAHYLLSVMNKVK